MNDLFIGIDFSLNSTSASILYPDQSLDIFCFIRDDDWDRTLRSKTNPHRELDYLESINLNFLKKIKVEGEYHEKERQKLNIFKEQSIQIRDTLLSIRSKGNYDNIYIGLEGMSFQSNGQAKLDLPMANMLLRFMCLDVTDINNFYVFSPGTVKKSTGYKGNAKKWEMYEAVCKSDISWIKESEYSKLLRDKESDWVYGKDKKVRKPVEDINDSIWVLKCLKELINK